MGRDGGSAFDVLVAAGGLTAGLAAGFAAGVAGSRGAGAVAKLGG